MVITSQSEQETREFASSVAEKFKTTGGVIALIGDLGAGKTTFTQGFALSLGIQDKIISPTFTLMRQHHLPDTDRMLYHLDLYRLETVNPTEIGLTELMDNPQNIVLIEWAEKLGGKLPKEALVIIFKHLQNNIRKIEF